MRPGVGAVCSTLSLLPALLEWYRLQAAPFPPASCWCDLGGSRCWASARAPAVHMGDPEGVSGSCLWPSSGRVWAFRGSGPAVEPVLASTTLAENFPAPVQCYRTWCTHINSKPDVRIIARDTTVVRQMDLTVEREFMLSCKFCFETWIVILFFNVSSIF